MSDTVMIIVVKVVVALLIGIYPQEQENLQVPKGYSSTKYTIVEIMDTACNKSIKCETPPQYRILSNCPYTATCLNSKCTVVCPQQVK